MNEKRRVTKDRLLSEERKRGTPLRIMKETRWLKPERNRKAEEKGKQPQAASSAPQGREEAKDATTKEARWIQCPAGHSRGGVSPYSLQYLNTGWDLVRL
jgi:hypothetical protein